MLAVSLLLIVGCSTSHKKDEEKSDLYLQMGISQFQNGNYPFALRDLLKSEELNAQNVNTQNMLGLTYFMREHYDLAEQHLHRALQIQPTFTEARNNLGRVLIEEGKYVEAEKELAIVLNDLTYADTVKAYINMGLARFNQKNYALAAKAFESAVKEKPDSCIPNSYRGRSYFEMKDYSKAAEALDRAIGFCQKELNDEPHYYSALAYYRLGDKSKAIARFEELIKYYPNGTYREKAKGMLDLIRKGN